MKLSRLALSALVVFAVCVSFASLAHAQATRTWVSGVGDDANPCSRTAPCKTFAGAISKTAPEGEINCLDPGGFGAVTITKAITIDCLHTLGGVLAAGTNGVRVLAGGSDRIVLRGLDINGAGSGVNGILFTSGGSLHVENSVIYGMQNGINIGAGNEIYIKNTYIRNNSNIGVYIAGSGGLVNAVIEKTTVENQMHGLYAGANTRVTTRGSVYSGHSNIGIFALGGSPAEVNVDSCIVTNNGIGLYSSGAQAIIRVATSFITGNNFGVLADGSGIVATFSDNRLHGNISDGAFNLGLTPNWFEFTLDRSGIHSGVGSSLAVSWCFKSPQTSTVAPAWYAPRPVDKCSFFHFLGRHFQFGFYCSVVTPLALPSVFRYLTPAVAKTFVVTFRSHNGDRPSKFIVVAANRKHAINMAWEHGGADFQSRFD